MDDHPLMRRGIRQLLELDPAFYVVAEAGDGASAIDLADRCEIQVSYAIGVAEPTSIMVETFGTEKVPAEQLILLVRE
ncbi:methionine adenosyltransferase domain-containing protein, partial [Salmonella enterica subsp. enterica serovar Montevideo]|nr:methionine adenosyltransferase domain-containing protein [Salmonella enterica subsp. enterica serovar Montevideo]